LGSGQQLITLTLSHQISLGINSECTLSVNIVSATFAVLHSYTINYFIGGTTLIHIRHKHSLISQMMLGLTAQPVTVQVSFSNPSTVLYFDTNDYITMTMVSLI
jgi:hypothetical protein